jgi:hypothetical protein
VPVCLREDGKVLTPALQKEFEKVQVDLGSGLRLAGKIHDTGANARKAGVLTDKHKKLLDSLEDQLKDSARRAYATSARANTCQFVRNTRQLKTHSRIFPHVAE